MSGVQMSFENSLAKLFSLAGDDFSGIQEIHEAWESSIRDDRGVLKKLYDFYFTTLRVLLNHPASGAATDFSDVQAHRFITAFSSSRYLGREHKEAWRLLQEGHAEHLALIKKALARPNYRITAQHLRTDTGNWGDIPGAMLEVYNWHRPYDVQGEQLMMDIAPHILEFYRAFPAQENSFLLRTLELHPDAIAQFAALMRFYILDRGNTQAGPMPSLASDMLGFYTDKSDFAHANGVKILVAVLADVGAWPAERVIDFIQSVILRPLDIEPCTQAYAADEMRRNIESQIRHMAWPYKAHLGTSAESQKERDEKYLAQYKAELALIEGDFNEWNARRRRKAAARVAVSPGTRKALDCAMQKVPDGCRRPLQDLLDEAAAYARRPKRFTMPKAAENRFRDFGLKLLVIEELMYRQQVLLPMFDIREFAGEYEKREISVESDGYEIIPEAAQYFRNLALSDELLARVETLHQSSGLDGGPVFMNHLFPFWDPGAGDEPVKVTNKAADDLALLPNLHRITGLENSEPGRSLLNALSARGIELSGEEA